MKKLGSDANMKSESMGQSDSGANVSQYDKKFDTDFGQCPLARYYKLEAKCNMIKECEEHREDEDEPPEY